MNPPGMQMNEVADLMDAAAKAAGSEPDTPRMLDVEFYIKAAQQHAYDSEPDHEVGDLQDFLRAMWSLLSAEQRQQFARSQSVVDVLHGAGVDFGDDLAAMQNKESAVGESAVLTGAAVNHGMVDVASYLYP